MIQAPQASNCGATNDTTLLRIYVNDRKRGAGVPPRGTVRVNVPKEQPCTKGGFYDAARILVFYADVSAFERLLSDGAQKGNDLKVPWAKDICANDDDTDPACWVGLAGGAYLPDAPAQLLEYTIISQVGNAKSSKDQNDPDGISVLDFDFSYVDDAYLPATMAVDGGITAYMGSKLALGTSSHQRHVRGAPDELSQRSELAVVELRGVHAAQLSERDLFSARPEPHRQAAVRQQRDCLHQAQPGGCHVDVGVLLLHDAVGQHAHVLPGSRRQEIQPDVRLPEPGRQLLPRACESARLRAVRCRAATSTTSSSTRCRAAGSSRTTWIRTTSPGTSPTAGTSRSTR